METNQPVDKCKIIFLIFCLFGVGAVIPWFMFTTAKKYFVGFKLDESYTGVETHYATYFLNSVGLATQIPSLIFNLLNIFVRLGGDITKRIVWSLSIEIIIFLFTTILAMIDSSSWPGAFFWVTMMSLIVINMANGIFHNIVFGMAAILPRKYSGAVVLGINLCGLAAAIMSILTSIITSSARTAAIYYFIIGICLLLLSLDTYFALPLNKFYRYYQMLQTERDENESSNSNIPYWKIFKEASPQLLNVFLLYFVTLSIFPAMYSDIELIEDGSWFPVSKNYFADITCFLTYNLFNVLGSLTTSWIKWPSPKYLVWPVVLRIVFIPLFFFCNYHPLHIHRSIPVLITNNWVYWGIAILMAYSSGYLCSLAMMYAPKSVDPKYQRTAGMFAGVMLRVGVLLGVVLSTLFPLIVAI